MGSIGRPVLVTTTAALLFLGLLAVLPDTLGSLVLFPDQKPSAFLATLTPERGENSTIHYEPLFFHPRSLSYGITTVTLNPRRSLVFSLSSVASFLVSDTTYNQLILSVSCLLCIAIVLPNSSSRCP